MGRIKKKSLIESLLELPCLCVCLFAPSGENLFKAKKYEIFIYKFDLPHQKKMKKNLTGHFFFTEKKRYIYIYIYMQNANANANANAKRHNHRNQRSCKIFMGKHFQLKNMVV